MIRVFRRDDGFTLVEALVALVLIFGMLLVLLRTFDSGVRVLVETKRQANASAFASELIERARSLEWEHMGLAASLNGTACPDQVGCATFLAEFPADLALNTAGNWAFGGEEIVFNNGDAFRPFLDFHLQEVRDDTVFDRYLVITSVRDDPLDPATERYRRLTAIVRWTAPSGFRDEVRLTTLVSEFRVPAQPLIRGDVVWSAGTFGLGCSAADCTVPGAAFIEGTTDWIDPALAREAAVVGMGLPRLTVSAISDYVSSATVRADGTFLDATFVGPDGVPETADDTVTRIDPATDARYADDDGSSAPPVNTPPAFTLLAPPFVWWDTGPRGVEYALAADELYPKPFDPLKPPKDNMSLDHGSDPRLDEAELLAEAWTEHDPLGNGIDDLPYAQAVFDPAEEQAIGAVEYLTDVEAWYEAQTGKSLKAPFEFMFARVQHQRLAANWTVNAEVDRQNVGPTADDRQVVVNATTAWNQFIFFDDTAYGRFAPGKNFVGWLFIRMPDIAVTDLAAGEGVVPLETVGTTNVEIWVWDPVAETYNAIHSAPPPACGTPPATVLIDDGAGGPLTASITGNDVPDLRYAVQGSVVIRPACLTTATDLDGNRAETRYDASQLVSGTLRYKVVDEYVEANPPFPGEDGVLFDIEVAFDTGGMTASSLFLDPEAQP